METAREHEAIVRWLGRPEAYPHRPGRVAHVVTANGTLGLPDRAPFDGIVVTAGGTCLPKPFLEQLSMSGRIVIPLGDYLYDQLMYRFTTLPDELKVENLGGFAFVPLIGRHGWDDSATTR